MIANCSAELGDPSRTDDVGGLATVIDGGFGDCLTAIATTGASGLKLIAFSHLHFPFLFGHHCPYFKHPS
jgi:hypothetical protein